jgi:UDP-glucose 4-epimerase
MRIGITGGAGFIGSNLAASLARSGHEISIFDNFETGFRKNIENLSVNVMQNDLRDMAAVNEFFSRFKIEYCVHLGALGSVPRSIENPRASFESNATATLNVLEAARISLTPVLFSSSSSVYGSNNNLPKIEKDWLSPLSPYAASKLAAESLILSFRKSYELPIAIYRLFNVYGPHQNSESLYAAVLPKWILAAFNNQPLVVFGDGEQRRDFTFVDDVIKVFENSVIEKHDIDYPINLAFGKPVTLNQILQIFKTYFGKIKVEYRDVRKGDIRDSESNPVSLMNLHDHKLIQTPLEIGLTSTFEWFKINYNF